VGDFLATGAADSFLKRTVIHGVICSCCHLIFMILRDITSFLITILMGFPSLMTLTPRRVHVFVICYYPNSRGQIAMIHQLLTSHQNILCCGHHIVYFSKICHSA